MSEFLRTSAPPSDTHAWRAVENLLDQLAHRSGQALTATQFYQALVDDLSAALSVSAAAVWSASALEAARPLVTTGSASLIGAATRERTELRARAISEQGARVARLSYMARDRGGDKPADATERQFLWIAQAVVLDGTAVAVIELATREDASHSNQDSSVSTPRVQNLIQVLGAVAELAADFHRNLRRRELETRVQGWHAWRRFVETIHSTLKVRDTAAAIANDGRQVLECQRLSVLTARRRHSRLLSVSGVDTFDRRSASVRRLQKLVTTVARTGEPLYYPNEDTEPLPEIAAALDRYLDESHAVSVAVIPLAHTFKRGEKTKTGRPHAALVAESFDEVLPWSSLRDQVEAMSPSAELALYNAARHSRLPLVGVWEGVGKLGHSLVSSALLKTLVALAAIAGIVAALIFVPADFTIEARGELQPRDRQNVFAASEGVISELAANHGDHVKKGQVLARLRKPQLDFEEARVNGELHTARTRLDSIQKLRLAAVDPTNERKTETPDQVNQRTADEEELKAQIAGLEKQQQVLKTARADLEVRSPQDGVVLSWNVERTLAGRPVEHGEQLFVVANPDGPWDLELQVPDNRSGDLLAAEKQAKTSGAAGRPQLSYILATDPGKQYSAEVTRIAHASEVVDPTVGPTLAVTAALKSGDIPTARAGAAVVARIDCGKRSLGYVWLHDLWYAIRSHWWF